MIGHEHPAGGRRPTNPWWFAGSVVVHALLIAGVVVAAGRIIRPVREVRFITLAPDSSGGREVAMPYGSSRPSDRAPTRRPAEPPPRTADAPVVAAATDAGRAVSILAPLSARDTVLTTDTITGTGRQLGPAYATGRLWERPVPGGRRVTSGRALSDDLATHLDKVDSALVDKIRAFIDTFPIDSFAGPRPQKWTTEINGKTWGIDEQWIYLGDLKIPSMVLALLPLPAGNYDQALQARQLQYQRGDIMQADMRAQNMNDFKRYVKEIRERKDKERAEERARRVIARDSL